MRFLICIFFQISPRPDHCIAPADRGPSSRGSAKNGVRLLPGRVYSTRLQKPRLSPIGMGYIKFPPFLPHQQELDLTSLMFVTHILLSSGACVWHIFKVYRLIFYPPFYFFLFLWPSTKLRKIGTNLTLWAQSVGNPTWDLRQKRS